LFEHGVCLQGQGTSFDPVLNIDGKRIEHRGHTTDVLNTKATEFVSRDREKPFCLDLAR